MARHLKVFRQGARRSARLKEKRMKEINETNQVQASKGFPKFLQLPPELRIMIYRKAMPPRIISPCHYRKQIGPYATINQLVYHTPGIINEVNRPCVACTRRRRRLPFIICAREKIDNGILHASRESRGNALNHYHKDEKYCHLVQYVTTQGNGAQFDYFRHEDDIIFYEPGMMVDWWRLYENPKNVHHKLNFAISLQGSNMQPCGDYYNWAGWTPDGRSQSAVLLYSIECLYHEFEDKITDQTVPQVKLTISDVKACYIILTEKERYHAEHLGDGPFPFLYSDWDIFTPRPWLDAEERHERMLGTCFSKYMIRGCICSDMLPKIWIIYR